MKNISKIANEILKESADQQTVRGIKLLWNTYRDNIAQFGKSVGNLIRRNRLSLSQDRNWILKALENITGEQWMLSGYDFKMASK